MQKLWGSSFFPKYSKFNVDSKKAERNWEKFSCFWDNCIWIGIVKLSLLRTRYLSSAGNVLTSSPEVLHVNKRDLFRLSFLASDQWIRLKSCHADFNSALEDLPYFFLSHPLKLNFLDIYQATFSESVSLKIEMDEGNLLSQNI